MTMKTIRSTDTGLTVEVAEPEVSRATIYALHGGGLSASYWDCPADPTLSFMRVATSLGFRVVAMDRPGCGANADRWPGGIPAADEAQLHVDTIDAHWPDEPLLLLAHSAGSMIALHMAALHALPALVGVDYSGVGIALDIEHQDVEDPIERFWGPARYYPEETFTNARVTTKISEQDGATTLAWPQTFPSLAAQIQVPVRLVFVDSEAWWGPIEETLAQVASQYTMSPMVETRVEYRGGHNLSVSYAAASYHLEVAAFAERCLRWATTKR